MQILSYNVCRSFQFCGPPMIKLNQLYLLRLEKECFCYIQQSLQVIHLFFLKSMKDGFIKVGRFSFDLHAQQHAFMF